MEYREAAVAEAPFVEKIWSVRGHTPHPGPETIFPDGAFELIFNLAEPVTQRAGETEVAQPRAMLVGEIRRAVTIEAAPEADIIAVRLTPGRARELLRIPLAGVRDRMIDLAELFPATPSLTDRLRDTRSFSGRVAILKSFLERNSNPGAESGLAWNAAAAITRTHGRVSISRLSQFLGVSVRALRRGFESAVGMSPKTYARVVRMRHALELLRRGEDASSAALTAGFYDQSHFVNEFRSFAGVSPSRYIEVPSGLAVHLT